jgi:hypothetical protein
VSVSLSHVAEIGSEAFLDCYGLQKVIGNKIKIIRNAAFQTCHFLQEINTSQVEVLEDNAFHDCFSLNNLDLSKLKAVEDSFYRCLCLVNVKCNTETEEQVLQSLNVKSSKANMVSWSKYSFNKVVLEIKQK